MILSRIQWNPPRGVLQRSSFSDPKRMGVNGQPVQSDVFQSQRCFIRFGEQPSIQETWDKFERVVRRMTHLKGAQATLDWESWTGQVPTAASELRAQQLSTLASVVHELGTSDTLGDYLKILGTEDACGQLSPVQQTIVRAVQKDYDQQTKLPQSLVEAWTRVTSEAYQTWEEAKRANDEQGDFKRFSPALKQVLDLERQRAQMFGYEQSPYDALLNVYEPGMTVETLDPIFSELREGLLPIIKAIQVSRIDPPHDFLYQSFDMDKQRAFAKKVIGDLGYSFSSGSLFDPVEHPFCTSQGTPYDVRIASRIKENDLLWSIGCAVHEAGHGVYSQGVNPAYEGSPVADSASLGMDESQSRLFETILGQSLPFWTHYYPQLQTVFPKQFGRSGVGYLTGQNKVSLQEFYKALNRVQPGPIRLEADEVTYNMHILIRYELERDMMENRLEVDQLPAAWADKYEQYLGVRPENDTEGVLQDCHWSDGFGYFPTYTIGNLVAAQLMHTMRKEFDTQHGPGFLDAQIAGGDPGIVQRWMRRKVYWMGASETTDEILNRVTGESLNPKYFLNYIKEKYSNIYTDIDWAKL